MTTHDCFQEIDKAKNVSRATWICSCGRNVSLMYYLWYQAVQESETTEQLEDVRPKLSA